MTLTAGKAAPSGGRRPEGAVLLSEDADPDKADHVFDAKSFGTPAYDPKEGAVVGAGAVVCRPLPDRVIAVGAPARVVRVRGEARGDQK
jgi:hypothetical protein